MFHAIIQARMGSTRLPGKVLKKYKDKTPLCILIDRLKKIEKINKIIISTTNLKEDNVFERYCKKKKILIFKGDTQNVLNALANKIDMSSSERQMFPQREIILFSNSKYEKYNNT